jgi:hypothetical protein
MPMLRPRYVARIEIQVVQDATPEADIGIMYPNVEVIRAHQHGHELSLASTDMGTRTAEALPITPTSLSVPLLDVEVRLATVEIRDTAYNRLVTSIEILSPVNKREPGLSTYREKRRQLHAADVHVLEIDLLRRGQRSLVHPRISPSVYRMTLIRAAARCADIWSLHLQDTLPIVPIPLRAPDADIPLDLATAFTTIYDRAAYDLSLSYAEQPPPPPLSTEAQVWVRQRLSPSA